MGQAAADPKPFDLATLPGSHPAKQMPLPPVEEPLKLQDLRMPKLKACGVTTDTVPCNTFPEIQLDIPGGKLTPKGIGGKIKIRF